MSGCDVALSSGGTPVHAPCEQSVKTYISCRESSAVASSRRPSCIAAASDTAGVAAVSLPIAAGRLCLGTWQGIYLCEHRSRGGPRRLVLTLHGE